LLQELFSVLWAEQVTLFDLEKDKIRKQRKLPSSFADMVLNGKTEIRSAAYIAEKWALPNEVAAEYTRIAPIFSELRNWRDRVIHSGGTVGHVYTDESGFMIDATDKLFSWANCWAPEEVGVNNLAPLDPWLEKVVFESMNACNRFVESFARTFSMPAPIAPGLMVYSRSPMNEALHLLKDLHELQTAKLNTAKNPNY